MYWIWPKSHLVWQFKDGKQDLDLKQLKSECEKAVLDINVPTTLVIVGANVAKLFIDSVASVNLVFPGGRHFDCR